MSSVSLLVKQSKNDGAAAMALSQCRLYGIGCKPDRRAAFNAVRFAARLGHPAGFAAGQELLRQLRQSVDPAEQPRVHAERRAEQHDAEDE